MGNDENSEGVEISFTPSLSLPLKWYIPFFADPNCQKITMLFSFQTMPQNIKLTQPGWREAYTEVRGQQRGEYRVVSQQRSGYRGEGQ